MVCTKKPPHISLLVLIRDSALSYPPPPPPPPRVLIVLYKHLNSRGVFGSANNATCILPLDNAFVCIQSLHLRISPRVLHFSAIHWRGYAATWLRLYLDRNIPNPHRSPAIPNVSVIAKSTRTSAASLLFLHHPYMLLFGIHWIFHLLVSPSFLMCYAQCCHGDGSGVRHVNNMKYHGHSLYYQATVLAIA